MELPPSTAVPVKGMRNNVFLFAPHTTAGPVGMGSDHSDKDVCVKMGKQPMARLARQKAKGCTVNYQRAPPYVTARPVARGATSKNGATLFDFKLYGNALS